MVDQNAPTVSFEYPLKFENGGAQLDYEMELPNDANAMNAVLSSTPATMSTNQYRDALSTEPYLKPGDKRFWHGRLIPSTANLTQPKTTWRSPLKPRDDHDGPDWLTASEYQDSASNLQVKIQHLVSLLRASKKTVVYSGAGISVAAGIGQAARGQGRGRNLSTTAQPTFTHHALATLAKHGLIHGWVQQNHDGLPQKAGFPQEHINEIHGSWYDPSNPVVKYSGTLRDYECEWLVRDADAADLALVLGTSLGGLNSDQVALKTAARSKRGKSLGMVLINLQQTEHDGKATLRMFDTTDKILVQVVSALGLTCPTTITPPTVTRERRVLVPYDERGRRSTRVQMWWDLRPGAEIQFSPCHHNIAGAQQPCYMHMAKSDQPHGKVLRWRDSTSGIDINMQGSSMQLGQWWIDAALNGGPPILPVVNVEPEMVPVNECGEMDED